MKKIMMRSVLLLALLVVTMGCQKDDEQPIAGTVADPDGQEYEWKRMDDGKIWLVENLNYEIEGYNSWWYDNEPTKGDIYGRLYYWETAIAVCLTLGDGWHLPTDEEWKNLAIAYGGYYDTETNQEVGDAELAFMALQKGGNSGFAALLGGYLAPGYFNSLGRTGYYWSTQEVAEMGAISYDFSTLDGKLLRDPSHKMFGYSCRCVKDVDH
jgi:uncharacterized protein (TIGR02145 family)